MGDRPMRVEIAPAPRWLIQVSRRASLPWSRGIAATTTSTAVHEGQRNDTLFRIGCALPSDTATEEVEAFLSAANDRRCKPPLPDSEVSRIAKSVCRHLAKSAANVGRRRFRLLSIERLRAFPDLEWLVKDIIPEGALCEMHGMPNVGKSFLALDIALAVATGNECLGQSVAQGDVVYVAAEGARGLKPRVNAWLTARGPKCEPKTLHVLPTAVQLLDPKEITELVEVITEDGIRPKLIVIDTLARCFVGGDESSARDMGLVISNIDELRHATGASILIVHHTTKDGRTERGSGALRGAADVMMTLVPKRDVLELSSQKAKDTRAFSPLRLRLVESGDSMVVELTASAGVPHPDRISSDEASLLDCLQRLGGEGIPSGRWMETARVPKTTFERHKKRLVEMGYVVRERRGVYTVAAVHGSDSGPTARQPGPIGATPLPGGGHGPSRRRVA